MKAGDGDSATAEPATVTAGDAGGSDPAGFAETAAPSWWDDSAERRDAAPAPVELTEVSPAHYEMLGEHGRGGLGRVLRARDRRTGRIVALKEILRGSDSAVRRFRREALVTANLQHPAIVPVYEVGCWPDGQPFYTMKLVDGVPLSTAIRGAADAGARLALLPHVIQVADALGYAHAQGWIHRDLKPGNVLVGAFGETVVIDWGLAKRVHDHAPASQDASDAFPSGDGAVTLDGHVLGTPVYMSPEQARGDRLDAGADVYAIGALLYHVLAGHPPYHDARTTAEVIARVTAGPPRALGDLAPGLPPELGTIVARAMAHRASDRYPSARELAADLARFRAGNLVAAHRYTAWQLVRRWLGRHRTAVTVAALAAVALAAVGVVSFRENVAARRRAEAEGARATAAQAVADERRREAEARLTALHTEIGLRELSGGSAARALPYLADAHRRSPEARVNRFLLARALESITLLELAVTAAGTVESLAFGGSRVVARAATTTVVLDLAGRRRLADVAGRGGALSADGQVVVAVSADRQTLIAFDAASGVERGRRLLGDDDTVLDVGLDAGGRVVAVAASGRVTRYDAALRPLSQARAPFAPRAFAVAATGRTLLGGPTGQVWAWDPATGLVAHDRTPHAHPITKLCVSDDGATWLTMDERTTRVWRAGAVIGAASYQGRADACDLDDGATRAVTVVEGQPVATWDLRGAQPVLTSLDATTNVAAISRDGSLVALGGPNGEVAVVPADGGPAQRLGRHDAPVAAIGISPDGHQIVSATAGGDVRVWRNAPTAVLEIDLGPKGRGGAFLDEDRLVATGSVGARLVSATDGRVLAELPGHGKEAATAAVSRDRTRFVTAGYDHSARLWTGDGAPIAELVAHTARIRRVTMSSTGDRILTASEDGTFAIWRARDGALERRVTVGRPLFSARISPDGRRVVTLVDGELGVIMWDADTGQQLADLPIGGIQPVDARFSPDGALVAIATGAPVAPVFDGVTGLPRFEVQHEAPVLAVAWAADGTLLATSDLAGTIRLSRRDGTRRWSIQSDGLVSALAVSPDGTLIAAGTTGGVRLLEIGLGRSLAWTPASGTVLHLEFSPAGNRLLIGQDGPGVRAWQLGGWTGTADELDQRLRCAVPYRLEGDRLVAAELDPTACR